MNIHRTRGKAIIGMALQAIILHCQLQTIVISTYTVNGCLTFYGSKYSLEI